MSNKYSDPFVIVNLRQPADNAESMACDLPDQIFDESVLRFAISFIIRVSSASCTSAALIIA
jgi:hypothetical protein